MKKGPRDGALCMPTHAGLTSDWRRRRRLEDAGEFHLTRAFTLDVRQRVLGVRQRHLGAVDRILRRFDCGLEVGLLLFGDDGLLLRGLNHEDVLALLEEHPQRRIRGAKIALRRRELRFAPAVELGRPLVGVETDPVVPLLHDVPRHGALVAPLTDEHDHLGAGPSLGKRHDAIDLDGLHLCLLLPPHSAGFTGERNDVVVKV